MHSKCLCNIHCMWIGACRLRVQGHAHDAVCMCPPLASPTQYQIMSHSGACLFTIISDSQSELSTRKGKKQAFKIAAGIADLAVPAPTTLVCVAAATVAAAGKDTSCDMQSVAIAGPMSCKYGDDVWVMFADFSSSSAAAAGSLYRLDGRILEVELAIDRSR